MQGNLANMPNSLAHAKLHVHTKTQPALPDWTEEKGKDVSDFERGFIVGRQALQSQRLSWGSPGSCFDRKWHLRSDLRGRHLRVRYRHWPTERRKKVVTWVILTIFDKLTSAWVAYTTRTVRAWMLDPTVTGSGDLGPLVPLEKGQHMRCSTPPVELQRVVGSVPMWWATPYGATSLICHPFMCVNMVLSV